MDPRLATENISLGKAVRVTDANFVQIRFMRPALLSFPMILPTLAPLVSTAHLSRLSCPFQGFPTFWRQTLAKPVPR